MPTPEDIEAREFLVSLRGFDRAEVRAFLSDVADQVRDLEARVQAGEAALKAQAAELSLAPTDTAAEAQESRDSREAQYPEDPSSLFAGIGRETTRILDAAQEAAQGLLRQARTDADRQMQSARQHAARLVADGEQRREEIEDVVAGLEAARESLSGNLHDVAVTIGRVLDELGTPPPVASTVREALTAQAWTAEAAPLTEETTRRPDPAREATGSEEDEDEPADAPSEPVERAEEPREALGPVEEIREDVEQAEEPQEAVEPVLGNLEIVEEAGEPIPDSGSEPLDRDSRPPDESADPGHPTGRRDDEELADVIDMQNGEHGFADAQDLRGRALTALHEPLVRAIKRELQEAHNVVLDRLRRSDGHGDLESLLPDDEVNRMGVAAAEYLQSAYQAGVHAAAILADRDLGEPTQERDRDLVAEFADDATARVSSPLAATLRMGRSGSERPPELSDRVGAVFSELKGSVAEELAGGHIIRAYELGLLDAWTAGGITHRRWVLGREPRCPEARCRQNDRAGVVAIGERYPSGHEVPPIHVGCNCTTIPVSEPPS